MACAVEMIHRLGSTQDVRRALEMEYRFVFRALTQSDLMEGIRAAVIDKDRNPQWRHSLDDLPPMDVTNMLLPLGKDKLTFDRS